MSYYRMPSTSQDKTNEKPEAILDRELSAIQKKAAGLPRQALSLYWAKYEALQGQVMNPSPVYEEVD